ncbi:hypothetical protein BKA80DRAFT_91301 [Phyllosticta citrichinensis]
MLWCPSAADNIADTRSSIFTYIPMRDRHSCTSCPPPHSPQCTSTSLGAFLTTVAPFAHMPLQIFFPFYVPPAAAEEPRIFVVIDLSMLSVRVCVYDVRVHRCLSCWCALPALPDFQARVFSSLARAFSWIPSAMNCLALFYPALVHTRATQPSRLAYSSLATKTPESLVSTEEPAFFVFPRPN